MKLKPLFIILSGIFLLSGNAFSQAFKNKEMQITKLYNNAWVVETSDMNTMYIIEGEKKALLIDTGTRYDSLDAIVRKITSKPLSVVITHAHGDHDGNVRFFNEIYIHPADTVLFKQDYKGKIKFIKEGYVFDLGGKKIEVKYMPAHTPGSIVLVDQETGSCYTGDAFGSGQVWLQLKPYAPMKSYISSCEAMLKLMDNGIDSLYCGHYPYLKSALNKEYITTMKNLATSIDNGNPKNVEPYPLKVSIGCDNPMIASEGKVAIVFDPEHIKF